MVLSSMFVVVFLVLFADAMQHERQFEEDRLRDLNGRLKRKEPDWFNRWVFDINLATQTPIWMSMQQKKDLLSYVRFFYCFASAIENFSLLIIFSEKKYKNRARNRAWNRLRNWPKIDQKKRKNTFLLILRALNWKTWKIGTDVHKMT